MRTGSAPLAVILPVGARRTDHWESGAGFSHLIANRWVAAAFILLIAAMGIADAQAGPGQPSTLATLIKWTPLIAGGFVFNIVISVLAMLLGTVLGALVGVGQISRSRIIRSPCWFATHFFRNAPWLVLLFYCMLLLPFQIRVGGLVIPLPDWIKATLGIAVAVAANVSEIVRGAIQSIPYGQWESAESLAFTRRQIIWRVILPQCVKRMLPPWMNLYALAMVSTPLCSIVGVSEVMTLTADALNAEGRFELLLPMYLYLLAWFFAYCYPIARWTIALEKRYEVKT